MEKLTALELSEKLDKLKNSDGHFSVENCENLANELKKFGPYYLGTIKILAYLMSEEK